jgi:hypothetical protein
VLIAAATALLHPANAFAVFPMKGSPMILEAVRSSARDTVQAVKPKSSSSLKKREEAIKAMQRSQMESALDGVDAQMLELLSDKFLYPSSQQSKQPSRPRGRPDFVPGAMKFDTMVKFRETREMMGRTEDRRVVSEQGTTPQARRQPRDTTDSASKKQSKVKGSTPNKAYSLLPEVKEGSGEAKKRKRVVKNLPKRKNGKASTKGHDRILKGKLKANNLELQKYYHTELLAADEEYSLAIKIQLMVSCEQVHEGLAIKHMRLPTIEEWAIACG